MHFARITLAHDLMLYSPVHMCYTAQVLVDTVVHPPGCFCFDSLAHSCITHALTQALSHSLRHLLTQPTHALTHSLPPSLIYSLAWSLTHALIPPPTLTFTGLLTHSANLLTYSIKLFMFQNNTNMNLQMRQTDVGVLMIFVQKYLRHNANQRCVSQARS